MSSDSSYAAAALANAFINVAATPTVSGRGALASARDLTRVEVELVVYVAHGISLALHDRSLLAEPSVAMGERVSVPSLRAALRPDRARPVQAFDPVRGAFHEVEPPPPSDVVAWQTILAVWDRYAHAGPAEMALDAQGPGSPWVQIVGSPGFAPGVTIPDVMTGLYFARLAADEIDGAR